MNNPEVKVKVERSSGCGCLGLVIFIIALMTALAMIGWWVTPLSVTEWFPDLLGWIKGIWEAA